jgi:hypothetical protein
MKIMPDGHADLFAADAASAVMAECARCAVWADCRSVTGPSPDLVLVWSDGLTRG